MPWSCASFSLTYLFKHLLQLLKLHETSVQTKATPIPGGRIIVHTTSIVCTIVVTNLTVNILLL